MPILFPSVFSVLFGLCTVALQRGLRALLRLSLDTGFLLLQLSFP